MTLRASTAHLDIHPLYLIVENHDNPDDLKTVLVSMELVPLRAGIYAPNRAFHRLTLTLAQAPKPP